MAYTTVSKVRDNINLDDNNPTTEVVESFINKADREIDEACAGDARRFQELVQYKQNQRFLELTHDFQKILELKVKSKTVNEFKEHNLLENPELEDGASTTVDDWNDEGGSGDTLSWASDYAFTLNRSIKIAKAAGVNSYWESDELTVDDSREYKAEARIKVDSNTSGNVSLRMVFKDSDSAAQQTFTSKSVSLEITQPSSASVIAVVSNRSTDLTQVITIEGTVDGLNDVETIILEGTSSVSTLKSFSYIKGIRKSSDTDGTVTLTSNSAVVTNATITAKQTQKEDWMKIEVIGSTVEDNQIVTVQFYCSDSTSSGNAWADAFRFTKRQWRPNFAARNIEVFIPLTNDEQVDVTYRRSEVSKIVYDLSMDLASFYIIVDFLGVETTGQSYSDVKYKFFAGELQSPTANALMHSINKNLKRLQSYDNSSTDCIVSETTH